MQKLIVKHQTLSKNKAGDEVVLLKQAMLKAGYITEREAKGDTFDDALGRGVRKYQIAKGILVDEIVGPQTWHEIELDKLLPEDQGSTPTTATGVGPDEELSLELKQKLSVPELVELGVKWMEENVGNFTEVPGSKDNPHLVKLYEKYTSYRDNVIHDEIPECAVGNCARLEKFGLKSPHNALAYSFYKFGQGVKLADAKRGDALVHKWSSGHYHTSVFHHFASDGTVACIGFNQSNQLKISYFPKASIIWVGRPIEKMKGLDAHLVDSAPKLQPTAAVEVPPAQAEEVAATTEANPDSHDGVKA